MFEPGTLNLTMYQGASWDYTLTWTTSGSPVNLTNYTARMDVRVSHDAPHTVLELTSGSGITLGGTAGTILLEASPTTTAGVASGQYVYDLELVSPGSAVTRLVEGTLVCDPEVTR
jgi:hypothetical protein